MALSHILNNYFNYYRQLDPGQKILFEERVSDFLLEKDFLAKGGLSEITEEMKVVAAATAIQLTFGLGKVVFDHFKTIIFYPSEFYSNYSHETRRSEVNPDGVIVFSWKDLAAGILNPEEYPNLGLRAFAEALGIQNNTEGPEYDVLDLKNLHLWKGKADEIYESVRALKTGIFYFDSVNKREEFFPACVDFFFQKYDVFKKEYYDLYVCLSTLLKQDPK